MGDQALEGGFLINDAGRVNEFGRAFAHAVVGCMAGAAGASASGSNTGTGSGCGAGALGAVVGEFSAQLYGAADPAKTIAFASMMSGIAAAAAGQGAEGVAIAASTGANAAQNNRLLHISETQRIKELAKGDKQKEARLTAAACALVRCADGVPKDDPAYAYLKGLQEAGANLTDEKSLLIQQKGRQGGNNEPLFQYTGVDQYIIDPWTQNKVGTRLVGAGQAGLGVVGAVGSAGLCTTGIGCAAGAITGTVSVDYAWAGAKQSVTGNAQIPYGEQVLQSLGLIPQGAAYTYAVLGLAPVGVEAYLANKAINQSIALNAAAKESYAIPSNLDELYGAAKQPNLIKLFEVENKVLIQNPELKIWQQGEKITLDPSKQYIYSVNAEGKFVTGVELKIGRGPNIYDPKKMGDYNLGHPTLNNGKPARISGELRYENGGWVINGNSGRYTKPYADRTPIQLENAATLARSLGLPVKVAPLQPVPKFLIIE